MKKLALVLALALAMTFAFCAVAFADHAPNNYITWNSAGVNSSGPHADYQLTTTKCNVCHAVHRAAVPNETIGGVTAYASATGGDTQMLLRSSVARACNYCHMDTAVGGIRLWNGNSTNWGEYEWTNGGFAHGNGCTACHAVHGAKTFKGAAESKILRYDIKAAVVTGEVNPAVHTYAGPYGNVQTGIAEEIFATSADTTAVAAGSDKLFGTLANAIEGAGLQTWTNAGMQEAQVTAFCTCCHSNYSSDSEVVINLDQDVALFGGSYSWATDSLGGTYKHKNHPVSPVWSTVDANNGTTLGFNAGGATVATSTVVAWADASTCRACHDAGTTNAAAGVVVNSYPHVTPGYYRFMGRGSSVASYAAANLNDTSYFTSGLYMDTPVQQGNAGGPDMTNAAMNLSTDGLTFTEAAQDGYCIKCHVQGGGATDGGIGRNF